MRKKTSAIHQTVG